MGVRVRSYSGSVSSEVTERELRNREISRKAAGEGVVLLENDGILPLSVQKKLAVYGNGIAKIIKGGTGSGDVNERSVVPVLDGLLAAGFTVVNEAGARAYMEEYQASRRTWRDKVLESLEHMDGSSDMEFFKMLKDTQVMTSEGVPIKEEELAGADAAVFIVSRVAGEGMDRRAEEGDYYLTQKEKGQLAEISKYNQNLIVLINTGGQIDLQEIRANDAVKAIVYLSQPGMEAGHVAADVLSGKVNPSGRLTTTWGVRYGDFPNAATFSHCNGDVEHERYEEGIYVGYRYFDSFGVKPLYPFGYGLSYTSFDIKSESVSVCGNEIKVSVAVTNTGAEFSGKQVVQVYGACPQKGEGREFKRLIGFGKTKLLAPEESETLTITACAKDVASYDYQKSAWVVEAGEYGILAGGHSDSVQVAGILNVPEDCLVEQVTHILPLQEELQERKPDAARMAQLTAEWKKQAADAGIVQVEYCPKAQEPVKTSPYGTEGQGREIAERMSNEELAVMLIGEMTKGQDNIVENELVETGIYVPGAAGETCCQFEEKYGIPAISMADGPAGLRLMRNYDVDNKTGKIYGHGLISALEGGLFAKEYHREDVTSYYMYATAIPIGTMLAQTWNPGLLEEVGKLVAGEMREFGVSWWLAPGMNIHRNPLCGRNFEYYSEDPLVAGTMAAAITNGVQSIPGCGTTIKHFACNNQEDNRLHSNSILSERALREIYLRGFEIAVKTSQPKCIMSSYNMINGVPAANNTDLITTVARGEWGFQGIVMTDWTTTTAGTALAHKCAEAGNDLIMPGNQEDVDDIMAALSSGALAREKAVECAGRLINAVLDLTEHPLSPQRSWGERSEQ